MTDEKIVENSRKIVSDIFEHLDVNANVKIAVLKDGDRKILKIEAMGGDDLGRLIGYHGRNLEALQMILGMLINKTLSESITLVLDVNGYRKKRAANLQAFAKKIAESVKSSGKPYELPPLPASERRIIHLALAKDEDVETESIGEGLARRVVIKPVGRVLN